MAICSMAKFTVAISVHGHIFHGHLFHGQIYLGHFSAWPYFPWPFVPWPNFPCEIFLGQIYLGHSYLHSRKSPKIFKWDKNSNQFFKETLKKDSISNRLNDICQQEISNPNAIALEISKLLIDTAKTAKIKFKKQISQPTNKISFDKECETGKLHLESLGKQTKKEIDNPNLRKEIRNQKRHFRNLIKQVRNFKGPPAFCQKQQTRSFPKNKPMSFLSLH